MGPSASGPLGPAPSGSSGPVDSNTVHSWLDPEGKAAEAADQGWRRFLRDPADWVTHSDVLRQNRQWGGREGAPMDRAGDFLTSIIGRGVSAVDPMENISRLRRLGGWFTGW